MKTMTREEFTLGLVKELITKDKSWRLTKIKAKEGRDAFSPWVHEGQTEVGKLFIREVDETNPHHFVLGVQGETHRDFLRTSLVLRVEYEDETSYRVETINSFYKLEIAG